MSIACNNIHPIGTKEMIAHFPNFRDPSFPLNENPKQANTLICRFMAVNGVFPAKDFRATGWIHSILFAWWAMMMSFVLAKLKKPLEDTGLFPAVRAMHFGTLQSNYHFFSVLEMYSSETCTLFTLVGELGFALHEMHEVSGLSIGEVPYEEYVPTT